MSAHLGKIAIVGSGAVGGYYGGMLARAGHDVRFLMRADLEAVQRGGLTISTRGERFNFPVKCAGSAAEIGPVDLVLIALKSTANTDLDAIIPPLLQPGTALLTLQNGLGNEEYLAARWGAENVMGALCFVCINRTAPGVIEHYDHGSISVGEFRRPASDRARTVAAALAGAGIEAKAVDDLTGERWRKLLWNIPFNGLSIAASATVDQVLADDGLRALSRRLMSEALDAARRLGHAIPDDYADWQIERSYSMGAYKSSSMIDYQAGRPVEIEAIWGEPLRQGTAAGAQMPELRALEAVVRHLAARRLLETRS